MRRLADPSNARIDSPPRRPAFLILTALLLLLGPGSGTPTGRAQEKPISSPLVERAEVRFITLDVVVEERAGRKWQRATDLRKEQVTVKVGGNLVTLDVFENRCGSPAAGVVTAEAPRPERPEGRTARATPGAEAGGDMASEGDPPPVEPSPVRYILYFDFTHLRLGGYHTAFQAAVEWAESEVQPSDEVMVVTGDRTLRIVRPLRAGAEGLRADLLKAKEDFMRTEMWAEWEGVEGNGRGRIGDIQASEAVMPSRNPAGYAGPDAGNAIANSYAEMDRQRTVRSMRNLSTLMTLFEEMEGTKNLVFFQSTVRLYPGSQYPGAVYIQDIETDVDRLARAANERNVRIYPVDAEGLELRRRIDPALTHLASETGGRWVDGTNRLGLVFDRVEEDASCFYRLGFRIQPRFSGSTDTVAVAVEGDRPYRVRHRRTLHDPTREERNRDRLQAAFLDPSSSTAFEIAASAIPLVHEPGGARVRLQIRVPLRDLLALPTLVDGEELRQMQVQAGGMLVPVQEGDPSTEAAAVGGVWTDAAPDRDSWSFSRESVLQLPMDWTGGNEERELLLTQEVHAPPGHYRLVAVVHDSLAQAVAARVTDVTVPAVAPALGTIRLAVDEPAALVMAAAVDDAGEPPQKIKENEIRPETPLLSARSRILDPPVLPPARAAHLVYALCVPGYDPPEEEGHLPLAFEGWSLERHLACGGWREPVDLSARDLPPPEAGQACVLLADALPPGIGASDCRFELALRRPGQEVESAVLEFQVGATE
jgi:VWFA-related protein